MGDTITMVLDLDLYGGIMTVHKNGRWLGVIAHSLHTATQRMHLLTRPKYCCKPAPPIHLQILYIYTAGRVYRTSRPNRERA